MGFTQANEWGGKWTLIRGSHRPMNGVANIKSLVANDITGFEDLTFQTY
jgi:hypothetical protein